MQIDKNKQHAYSTPILRWCHVAS